MDDTAAGTISTSSGSDTVPPTTAKDSIAAINQRAHAAVDKAAGMANQTTDWLTTSQKELTEKTCDYVKAKPMQAVGIAFVSGLLLGKLLK